MKNQKNKNMCMIEIDLGSENSFEEVSQIATEEIITALHKLSAKIKNIDVRLRFAVMPPDDIEVKFND